MCNGVIEEIDKNILNVDNVIISAGAYSIILADHIYKKNKNVLIIGGDLSCFFGIKTNRGLLFYKEIIEEFESYFIDVPYHMKPPNYKEIEDGCYW